MKQTLIKKIASLSVFVLIAAVSFCFYACKGGEKQSLKGTDEIFASIENKLKLPEMEQTDEKAVSELFGIDFDKIASYRLAFSKDRTLADEIGVFETADASYEQTLKKLLEARLERAKRAARDYSPEQYEIIKQARVVSKGGYLFYIVNKDGASVTEAVEKLIKAK